jgi:steroid delta-isomerase-like uncharacterized protein
MSERNKRIDRRFYEEAWNKGDYDLVDEITASDYVGYELPNEVIVGREGLKQNIATVRVAFPNLHFTIEDQIAEGDRVVTRWTARGTQEGPFEGIPPTGKQTVVTGVTISRIADGKFVEGWTSLDRLGLLQQLDAVPTLESARTSAGK